MRHQYEEQELAWTGQFKCEECQGTGKIARSAFSETHGDADWEEECEVCEGEGNTTDACLLQFNIIPGEPPIVNGPPEHCDPGSGPEVSSLRVMNSDGEDDWTESCINVEAAEEYICGTWVEPERGDM